MRRLYFKRRLATRKPKHLTSGMPHMQTCEQRRDQAEKRQEQKPKKRHLSSRSHLDTCTFMPQSREETRQKTETRVRKVTLTHATFIPQGREETRAEDRDTCRRRVTLTHARLHVTIPFSRGLATRASGHLRLLLCRRCSLLSISSIIDLL